MEILRSLQLEGLSVHRIRANKALNMLINLPWSNGMCIVDFCLDILHSDMYEHMQNKGR